MGIPRRFLSHQRQLVLYPTPIARRSLLTAIKLCTSGYQNSARWGGRDFHAEAPAGHCCRHGGPIDARVRVVYERRRPFSARLWCAPQRKRKTILAKMSVSYILFREMKSQRWRRVKRPLKCSGLSLSLSFPPPLCVYIWAACLTALVSPLNTSISTLIKVEVPLLFRSNTAQSGEHQQRYWRFSIPTIRYSRSVK